MRLNDASRCHRDVCISRCWALVLENVNREINEKWESSTQRTRQDVTDETT